MGNTTSAISNPEGADRTRGPPLKNPHAFEAASRAVGELSYGQGG